MNKLFFVCLISLMGCKQSSRNQEQISQNQTDSLERQNDLVNESDTLGVIQSIITKKFSGELLDYKTGNITLDSIDDIVFVVEKPCTANEASASDESLCRQVVILKGLGNGQYEVLAQNTNVIDCSDCGGASVGYIAPDFNIDNGTLTFKSLHGACEKTQETIVFEYNKNLGNVYLQKVISENYSCKETDEDGAVKSKMKTNTAKDFGSINFEKFEHQNVFDI